MLATKVFLFTPYNTTGAHFAKQDGNFPQEKILPRPPPRSTKIMHYSQR